jgi:DNA-binding response OmpR family regulator
MQASGKVTVLVSLHNQALRGQVSQFIAQAGYEVLEAASPARAESIANSHPGSIAVLLTDAPPRGAAEILSSANYRQRWMTALVISGDPAAVNEEAVPDPRLAFIEKPFAWRQLRRELAERITASQAARHRELLCWSAQVMDECERVFQQLGYGHLSPGGSRRSAGSHSRLTRRSWCRARDHRREHGRCPRGENLFAVVGPRAIGPRR